MMISVEGGSEIQGSKYNDNEENNNVKNQKFPGESGLRWWREREYGTSVDDEEAEILEEAPWEDLFIEENMLLRCSISRL